MTITPKVSVPMIRPRLQIQPGHRRARPLVVLNAPNIPRKPGIPTMKTFPLILCTGLFTALSSFGSEEGNPPHPATPKDGFVPNEQTAIQIAIAVWTPIYGKEQIEKQKPYKAWLKDGIWHVAGHLPENMAGGVAIAEIQKSDAKVVRVSHGK